MNHERMDAQARAGLGLASLLRGFLTLLLYYDVLLLQREAGGITLCIVGETYTHAHTLSRRSRFIP